MKVDGSLALGDIKLRSLPPSFGQIRVGRILVLRDNPELTYIPAQFPNVKGAVIRCWATSSYQRECFHAMLPANKNSAQLPKWQSARNRNGRQSHTQKLARTLGLDIDGLVLEQQSECASPSKIRMLMKRTSISCHPP